MFFSKTNSAKGREVSITPGNSDLEFLSYGRIVLTADNPVSEFETGSNETALICLKGTATIECGGESFGFGRYDALYVPKGTRVSIDSPDGCDIAECHAPVDGDYDISLVRYADVVKDGSLNFETGGDSNKRTVSVLIGKNVRAGRIIAGVTESAPGNWTSFPPHEHSEMLEEIYAFYDMPAPAYGIQLVYGADGQPDFCGVVRDGDAVTISGGFHPNVSVPEHKINFVWMMAAKREIVDRKYGEVNVEPGFEKDGTGLEAAVDG
ncbi:MAG: 5-deoxy-glucuronate isomerase [Pyrinomonadaceae bacterium]